LGFSSGSCGSFEWELDGDAAAAEVDHGDDGGGGVVAISDAGEIDLFPADIGRRLM
jgi:hypothetical protein